MNHLYFVIRGTVEVLSSDVIMAILGKSFLSFPFILSITTVVPLLIFFVIFAKKAPRYEGYVMGEGRTNSHKRVSKAMYFSD